MPRRNTKSKSIRKTKNLSIPFTTIAPGVTRCRNHLIIDANVPENPLEAPSEKEARLHQNGHPEVTNENDEVGGAEGDTVLGGSQTL